MNRRQYLARTGAAGASTGLMAAIAGCLDGLGGSDSADSSDVAVSDRTGERAIARAAGQLNKAAQSLDELGSIEDPESVEFDPSEPRGHLETARGHLETAASKLGDERQSDVATLRSYADALENLVAVTVTVTDDTIADDIDAVNATLEEDGDLERANAIVDDRYAQISGASERHATATATIDDLDGDRLHALAGIDLTSLEEGATTLGDAVTSLETLAGAYDATLDAETGYGALERGRSLSDDGEYEDARAAFETAESTFASAQQRLDNGLEDSPNGLVDYFKTASCQNGHLTDAASNFAAAAAAAANRNPGARTYRAEGEAALDAVGSCTD